MITMDSLPVSVIRGAGIFTFVLCAVFIFGAVRVLLAKLSRRLLAPYIVCFSVSAFACTCMDAFCIGLKKAGVSVLLSKFAGKIPAAVFASVIAVLVLSAVMMTVKVEIKVKNSLTPSSLRQGLDGLPDGICFLDREGMPALMNSRMQYFLSAAFGDGPDRARCLTDIKQEDLCEGCSAETRGDSVFLTTSDGCAWDVRRSMITTEYGEFCECIAYDVTALYGKSLEMRKRNRHLEAVNEKIRQYNKSMDSVIRDRELLHAKIKIHDDVGRALLSLRSYLNGQNRDRSSLTTLWRITVSTLRYETVEDTSSDRMESLRQAADAVDVKLCFDGEIPASDRAEEMTAAAVRECLTNTVKHANGSELYIKTSCEEGVYTIVITNNGRQPDRPIDETGGLRTLRSAAERAGGTMTTEWKNGFRLTVVMDLNRGDEYEKNKSNDS